MQGGAFEEAHKAMPELVGKGGREVLPTQWRRRVVFEEIFLWGTYVHGWVVRYTKRHPELAYVANGDPRQNKLVGEELVFDD